MAYFLLREICQQICFFKSLRNYPEESNNDAEPFQESRHHGGARMTAELYRARRPLLYRKLGLNVDGTGAGGATTINEFADLLG
jgi:hypothetical protein